MLHPVSTNVSGLETMAGVAMMVVFIGLVLCIVAEVKGITIRKLVKDFL
jgi:hypothetical protein